MYRAKSYRNNRLLVNRASQVRGSLWKSSVLDGSAFANEDVLGENQWIPVFAKSVYASDVPTQIGLIKQALLLSSNKRDRALLICILADIESIHKLRTLEESLIDELLGFVLHCDSVTEEYRDRAYICGSALAMHHRIKDLEILVKQVSHLITHSIQSSSMDQATELLCNLSIIIAYREIALDLPQLLIARDSALLSAVYSTLTSTGFPEYQPQYILKHIRELPLKANVRLSPRIPHIISLVTREAISNRSFAISDYHWFKSMLGDYDTICYGFTLLKKLKVDPDELLIYLDSLSNYTSPEPDLLTHSVDWVVKNNYEFLGPDELLYNALLRSPDSLKRKFNLEL